MRNSFQFVALPADRFAEFAAQTDDELHVRGAKRAVVDAKPGFPCRVSFTDAEVGETVWLLTHTHHDVASPHRGSGPIYVRPGMETAAPAAGEVPGFLRSRLLSVRAYDSDAMLRDAEVVQGAEIESVIARFFERADVGYLQVHNARPGCYMCTVTRANEGTRL